MSEVKERIDALVKGHEVVLFMKGSALFPQCGFSSRAVAILDHLGTPFETVDVLQDAEIRQGIKARRTRNEGRVRALEQLRRERSERRDRVGTARLEIQSAERRGALIAKVEHNQSFRGEDEGAGDEQTCLRCGKRLAPNEETCSACGWSFRQADGSEPVGPM